MLVIEKDYANFSSYLFECETKTYGNIKVTIILFYCLFINITKISKPSN